MKMIFLLLILISALCLSTQEITREELTEKLCTLPFKFTRRYIECILSNSPGVYRQAAEKFHECVTRLEIQKTWKNTNLVFSVDSLLCEEEFREHPDVVHCVDNIGVRLPTNGEKMRFKQVVENCVPEDED